MLVRGPSGTIDVRRSSQWRKARLGIVKKKLRYSTGDVNIWRSAPSIIVYHESKGHKRISQIVAVRWWGQQLYFFIISIILGRNSLSAYEAPRREVKLSPEPGSLMYVIAVCTAGMRVAFSVHLSHTKWQFAEAFLFTFFIARNETRKKQHSLHGRSLKTLGEKWI